MLYQIHLQKNRGGENCGRARLCLSIPLAVLFCLVAYFASAGQPSDADITYLAPIDGQVSKVPLSEGQFISAGDELFTIKGANEQVTTLRAGISGIIGSIWVQPYTMVRQGDPLFVITFAPVHAANTAQAGSTPSGGVLALFEGLYKTTGIYHLIEGNSISWSEGLGRVIMMLIAIILLYLGVGKRFEPLLLVPISFGCLLANIPVAGMAEAGGLLHYIFTIGINTGIFPLIIFMGVGAMTDFSPMLANPKTALLGGAAQVGIFSTIIGALALNAIPGINFSPQDAASIGIIGGADGPTAIFLSGQLSPRLLGAIAVSAYSYMALVPIIQPPIMKLLTTKAERQIKMEQLRPVSKREKIVFPIIVVVLCALFLPSAAPLVGMLMFGNLLRECGVTERLSDTAKNALINTVTIFLGLGVGSKLVADKFLNLETLGILSLGIVAFGIGTASGVIIAKVMNRCSKRPINPLIGAAGVSAVPMASRVVHKVGLENDPHNFLIMHAMGPNVAGVIGSAVAAGVLLSALQ